MKRTNFLLLNHKSTNLKSHFFRYKNITYWSFKESIPCSLSLANPSFIAFTCSVGCPCQLLTSPTTLNGCIERYDFVGLPTNFLSVKSGSSSITPVGSTK